jgi:hypothetical protein
MFCWFVCSKTIYFTSANNCGEFISCAHDLSQRKDFVLCSSHSAALLQAREDDSIPESELSWHSFFSHQLENAMLFKTPNIRPNYMGLAAGCTRRSVNDSFLFYLRHVLGQFRHASWRWGERATLISETNPLQAETDSYLISMALYMICLTLQIF